jgi:GAF domain-containing protein
MSQSFGARLREQRERQQIDLAAIVQQTKIKLSLLEELERDDVSRWPTGIFRRAYVRAYAHAIGLDQDVIVREFLGVYPEPPELVESEPQASGPDGPPMRLRYLVGSAIDQLSRLRRPAERPGTVPIAVPPRVQSDDPRPAAVPMPPPSDLPRLARLCSEFARLSQAADVAPLLKEVAGMLDAVGLIVWAWDPEIAELRPALAHGYSDNVMTHLPRVKRDADNATAAAFRSSQSCLVRGGEHANGALAVPIVSPGGCLGVLAIEVRRGSEEQPKVRDLATVLAAQLTRFLEAARPLAVADRRLA